jgi:Glycosyl hydrolases family 2
MNNSILDVELHTQRADAAEAEIWVRVVPEQKTPATELRGRLVGPQCPGVTTIEVAYPLRPFPHPPEGWQGLTGRVVIPEPNRWEPAHPFVYYAVIELWQDGERSDVRQVPAYRVYEPEA